MKKIAIVLALVLFVGEVILADKKQNQEIDPVDAIIEKSHQTMRDAAQVSEMADKIVVAQVQEMKEAIEVLEEENESLTTIVEEVKDAYNEMVVKYESSPAQQFDILAILPDSANRR